MSKRTAPQREVKTIWKSGEYGKVGWNHELSCGHIEIRKRKAPAALMACLQCERGGGPQVPTGVEIDPVIEMSSTEQRLKNLVSRRLGIGADGVDVVFDPSSMKLAAVRITLSPEEVQLLLDKRS